MRMLAAITLAAALVAIATGGAAPFGRVLLAAGLPGLAAGFFDDPAWRGVALYRAGAIADARDAFRKAHQYFNLGNAEAHLGVYAAALEAYDIAAANGDPDARSNFDLVAAFYAGTAIDADALLLFDKREEGPETESFVGEGEARATGTGDEVTNANTMLGLAKLDSRGRLGVRRIFDDKYMLADERWLQQLADVPGEYLKARIAHEAKARAKRGQTPPVPEDPR